MATEKKVKIKIPLTKNDAEDVYVAVNGRSFLIKRGEEVEVPESVVEVLENQEKMLRQAIAFENATSKASSEEDK